MLSNYFRYTHIYAADETAVWLDPAAGNCVEKKGSKEVCVLNTGHEKLRITVMLTARSDGRKLLPFILLSRKRPDVNISKKFDGKLILSWAGRTWMDDDLTAEYLDKVTISTDLNSDMKFFIRFLVILHLVIVCWCGIHSDATFL